MIVCVIVVSQPSKTRGLISQGVLLLRILLNLFRQTCSRAGLCERAEAHHGNLSAQPPGQRNAQTFQNSLFQEYALKHASPTIMFDICLHYQGILKGLGIWQVSERGCGWVQVYKTTNKIQNPQGRQCYLGQLNPYPLTPNLNQFTPEAADICKSSDISLFFCLGYLCQALPIASIVVPFRDYLIGF